MTENFETIQEFVKRSELTNEGSVIAVTNKATGGTIGTAATTVDVASTINVTQTTAAQTLTAPDLTVTTAGKVISVNNVGSQSFTFTATGLSTTIPAGHGIYMQWTGAGYSLLDGGGGSSTTPASVASTGAITSSSASAGVGYATGSGGTVTQITSRTTGVTLSKINGEIVLFSAAGSATPFTFVVTNTTVGVHDTITVTQQTGTDVYSAVANKPIAGTSFQVTITDLTGTTTEAPKFNFTITKGVAA